MNTCWKILDLRVKPSEHKDLTPKEHQLNNRTSETVGFGPHVKFPSGWLIVAQYLKHPKCSAKIRKTTIEFTAFGAVLNF